jgi:hypothetical protein
LATGLAAFGIFLLIDKSDKRRGLIEYRYVVMALFSIALGLLAHDGVLFTLLGMIPLVIYDFVKNGVHTRLNYKYITAGILIALALLVPWQIVKSELTTSDRLIKWHFAGVISVDDKRGTLQTIVDEYKKLSFHQWVSNKETNVRTLVDGGVHDKCSSSLRHIFDACHMASWRDHVFFSMTYAFEFFIFGFLIVAWQLIKRRLDMFDIKILLISITSILFWVFLMFIPGGTVLHQGSYATMFLLFVFLGKKLSTLPDALFVSIIGLQVALFYLAWLRPFGIAV